MECFNILRLVPKGWNIEDCFFAVIKLGIHRINILHNLCIFSAVGEIVHSRNTNWNKLFFRLTESLGKKRNTFVARCGNQIVVPVHFERIGSCGRFAARHIKNRFAKAFERSESMPNLNNLQVLFMIKDRSQNAIAVKHNDL